MKSSRAAPEAKKHGVKIDGCWWMLIRSSPGIRIYTMCVYIYIRMLSTTNPCVHNSCGNGHLVMSRVCGVWSVKCRVWIVELEGGVWSAKHKIRVWSAKCKVQGVERGVWGVKCGAQS